MVELPVVELLVTELSKRTEAFSIEGLNTFPFGIYLDCAFDTGCRKTHASFWVFFATFRIFFGYDTGVKVGDYWFCRVLGGLGTHFPLYGVAKWTAYSRTLY